MPAEFQQGRGGVDSGEGRRLCSSQHQHIRDPHVTRTNRRTRLNPHLASHVKIYSKRVIDLDVTPKSIKLLGEKRGGGKPPFYNAESVVTKGESEQLASAGPQLRSHTNKTGQTLGANVCDNLSDKRPRSRAWQELSDLNSKKTMTNPNGLTMGEDASPKTETVSVEVWHTGPLGG